MQKIKNVVVLMLENGSFDHVLGFLRPRAAGFEGLAGTESVPENPVDPGSPRVGVQRTTGTAGYITRPDPSHEFADVTAQLFGTESPVAGARPTNDGFYARFARLTVDGRPIDPDDARQVMSCFDTATQLPALATLANEFVVLDHWFASVPGPTWPNRFFAHCATSGGYTGSPDSGEAIWNSALGTEFAMPTIYSRLAAAGAPWAIYYHDVPQSLALRELHAYRGHFHPFHAFLKAAQAGTLPAYSFIEPAYLLNVPALGFVPNDMHPPHDVRDGERLIARVYNALRASPQWNDAALLIVWDEHGGFYDHVPPPDAAPPDDASSSSSSSGFRFDRLGVRVPAVLVSPWVARGAVDQTVYDHASIPATIARLFAPGEKPLTKRDGAAATFERNFALDAPRTDAPATVEGHAPAVASAWPIGPAGIAALAVSHADTLRASRQPSATLSTSQRALVALAEKLDLPPVSLAEPESLVAAAAPAGTIEHAVLRVSRYLVC